MSELSGVRPNFYFTKDQIKSWRPNIEQAPRWRDGGRTVDRLNLSNFWLRMDYVQIIKVLGWEYEPTLIDTYRHYGNVPHDSSKYASNSSIFRNYIKYSASMGERSRVDSSLSVTGGCDRQTSTLLYMHMEGVPSCVPRPVQIPTYRSWSTT